MANNNNTATTNNKRSRSSSSASAGAADEKKQRVHEACAMCHRKKVKCNHGRPCRYCVDHGFECVPRRAAVPPAARPSGMHSPPAKRQRYGVFTAGVPLGQMMQFPRHGYPFLLLGAMPVVKDRKTDPSQLVIDERQLQEMLFLRGASASLSVHKEAPPIPQAEPVFVEAPPQFPLPQRVPGPPQPRPAENDAADWKAKFVQMKKERDSIQRQLEHKIA
mmetsp:Transcript_19318/g.36361  ORF Transcript_19318/g.36361 Transcript_19318/m.36361 type:complete len:219 (-) Transcript_19318:515-1171(-)